MELKIYCIKDTLTEFMQPYYQANEHVAMRNFKIAMNDPASELKKIAENIELWELGTFDTVTGIIKSDLKYICKGLDVKKVTNNENN